MREGGYWHDGGQRGYGMSRGRRSSPLVIAAMMAVYLGAMMGSYPEGPSVGNVLGSCRGRWGEEQYSLT